MKYLRQLNVTRVQEGEQVQHVRSVQLGNTHLQTPPQVVRYAHLDNTLTKSVQLQGTVGGSANYVHTRYLLLHGILVWVAQMVGIWIYSNIFIQ